MGNSLGRIEADRSVTVRRSLPMVLWLRMECSGDRNESEIQNIDRKTRDRPFELIWRLSPSLLPSVGKTESCFDLRL